MSEIHRITKDGGVVEIITPHFSSDNFHTDPTHKYGLGIRSMNYFCNNIPNWKYKYIKENFLLNRAYISFTEGDYDFNIESRPKYINFARVLLIEQLINFFPRIYEKFLASFLPSNSVYFCLQVIKKKK